MQLNPKYWRTEMKLLTATILSLALILSVGLAQPGQAQVSSNDTEPQPSVSEQSLEVIRNGSQPSQEGPAEYFTGFALIDPLVDVREPSRVSSASVTFTPGARTHWHSHPLGQILIVTSGVGWVKSWNGQVQEIRPGDVVRIPPEQKHWHGATSTKAMTHIAIQEQLDGRVVDWMESVSDKQYEGQS